MRIKTSKLSGFKFSFRNTKEFLRIHKDVFVRHDYKPQIKNSKPFILDCGSHIGVTVLYFKKLFPDSRIVSFEPNLENYEILRLNVSQNNLKNVELVNAAIFDREGVIDFYTSTEEKIAWTWGDALIKNKWYSPESFKTIKVKSVKLSNFIKEKVDLIKLDIEGVEAKVLREIENKLPLVGEIVMEFHGSSTNPGNSVEEIVEILRKCSFSYTIRQKGKLVDESEIKKDDPYWLIIHAIKN